MDLKFQQIAKYSVLLSLIPAFFTFFFPGKVVGINVLVFYPLFFFMLFFVSKKFSERIDGRAVILLFFFYNFFIFIRGVYDASSREDWIILIAERVPILLFLPLTIYFGTKIYPLKVVFQAFLFYAVFFCLILLLGENLGFADFSHSVSPVYLLIIFAPILKVKTKFIIYFLALISFFSDLDVRSNLINIIVALLLSFTYRYKRLMTTIFMLRTTGFLLLIAPFMFLILGLSGIFNVFKISQVIGEITIQSKNGETKDFAVDSRTGVYEDVVLGLKKENDFIFGLGASGKVKTFLTDIEHHNYDKVYKEGRRASESGMLNFAQWGGIVGVLVYWLLFFVASYYGIYKSNNWISIMIGVWVAFKLFFSFIEDRLLFNIYSIFIFIPIGMCFNAELRQMNNNDIKMYLRSFFIKRN